MNAGNNLELSYYLVKLLILNLSQPAPFIMQYKFNSASWKWKLALLLEVPFPPLG